MRLCSTAVCRCLYGTVFAGIALHRRAAIIATSRAGMHSGIRRVSVRVLHGSRWDVRATLFAGGICRPRGLTIWANTYQSARIVNKSFRRAQKSGERPFQYAFCTRSALRNMSCLTRRLSGRRRPYFVLSGVRRALRNPLCNTTGNFL